MSSTERDFSEKFEEKLFSLIDKNSKIIVAFSGGCDSLGLLALCSKVVKKGKLKAVYVNHNIRSRSELEAETELNCFNCDILGVPLKILEIPPFKVKDYAFENDCGTEAAARVLRYELLEKELKESAFDYILTAHHLDDQIETVYMKKIQNSPITSLRGISEKKDHIIRPLLDFTKAEIKDYVISLGLSWSTDSTNTDNSILRNKIRNEIIPSINCENRSFEDEILQLRQQCLKDCSDYVFTGSDRVNLDEFKLLSESQKYICLFTMWDKIIGSFRGLSKALISRVISQCENAKDKEPKVIESSGGCFEIFNGVLYLSSTALRTVFNDFEFEIKDFEGGSVLLPGGTKLSWGKDAPLDTSINDLILSKELFYGKTVIRFARMTDRINLKDSSKTVLRLLQDLKVPSSLRHKIPVISDREGVCAVFAYPLGAKNRIAGRFCDKAGIKFVLSKAN